MSEIINNSASTIYNFNGEPNNTATSNVLPINYDANNGLSITKSSNVSTFSAGDIITYTIIIKNTSNQYLNGVRIIDNLGNGNLAYVLSSATLSTSTETYNVTPIATNPLTFTLQQLSVNSTMTLKYNCQVIFNLPQTVSLITNSVTGIGYPYSGTVTGYADSTIQKKTAVDFSITKTSNLSSVTTNQPFKYFITLENNTSNEANISSVTDTLPTNYTLTNVTLKIGNSPETTLSSTDYTLSGVNLFEAPSSTGPTITVPPENKTIITLTGFFN